MSLPDISGVWLSRDGLDVYTLTHIGNRFIWRAFRNNRAVETGIAWFPKISYEGENVTIAAEWSFDAPSPRADSRIRTGQVVVCNGRIVAVSWQPAETHCQEVSA